MRWNGGLGDFTVLPTIGATYLGRNLVSGDVIKATIVGSTISTFINGALMAQATDTTFKAGQPGISFFIRPGSSAVLLGLSSYAVTSK